MNSAHRRAARGFTLIEILVALLIFVTGVSGVYALISTGLAMQRDGLQLSAANGRLDAVVRRLELELGEGRHVDPASGILQDVSDGRLPDGTLYRVQFLGSSNADGGLILARLAVATGPAALARAPALEVVLTPAQVPDAEPSDL